MMNRMIRKRNVKERIRKCIVSILTAASIVCSLCGCGSEENAALPESAVEEDAAETVGERSVDIEKAGEQSDGAEKSGTRPGGAGTSAAQSAGTGTADTQQTAKAPATQEAPQNAQAGEDLDVVVPNAADDKWYMKENIYTDDNGRKLEVFFDDEGMLGFAIDGLSMYYTTIDDFQLENDWRIYTCDDGTVIIYYPGEPAHLEISDGEYAGIYEADDNI